MTKDYLKEEKVKTRPLKKYPCKRNKGEHEWTMPQVNHSFVEYVYEGKLGRCYSYHFYKDLKLIEANVNLNVITHCMWCGKKSVHWLSSKI